MMTKLEKMAEGWWIEQRNLNAEGEGDCFDPSPQSFMAGFRAAREAIREAIRTSGREGFDEWLCLKDFGDEPA